MIRLFQSLVILLDVSALLLGKYKQHKWDESFFKKHEIENEVDSGDPTDPLDMWERKLEQVQTDNFGKGSEGDMIPEACKSDIKNQLAVNKQCADQWSQTKDCKAAFKVPNYRLGDLFFGISGLKQNQEWTQFYFPDSIGGKYIQKKQKIKDFDTLTSILDSSEYASFERPDNHTLVVHLRAYDIYVFGAQAGYTKNAIYYAKAAIQAVSKGFKKVMIVSGDHWVTQRRNGLEGYVRGHYSDQDLERAFDGTKKKMAETKAIFAKAGMSVDEKVNGNADCDFLYMANALAFVPSRGNFDALITRMVELRGGQIIRG